MKLGVDLISDLCLSPDDSFNWEGKATSLYCLVAGNISRNLRTVLLTLTHLSKFYQGVFYTPGYLEFQGADDYNTRIENIINVCGKIPNVILLHHHVVIINGVAILGCTGGYEYESDSGLELNDIHKLVDLAYLKNSVERLQKHLDVKKILLMTNGVPGQSLYFGEVPKHYNNDLELNLVLKFDSELKITHWVYGSYNKMVDAKIGEISYTCNPYNSHKKNSYWAKRIEI